ncbi:MAG: DUF1127 domain-containing protein [Hyphomicrobiales bacterium]|nr:DUF1127 domain-containing protein [Hyphomicrobiales bacterium]
MAKHLQPDLFDWRRPFIAARALVALWLRRRRTRRHLRDLDAHLLSDIGIDEQARARECARWLWQGVPETDLAAAATNENASGFRGRAQFRKFENADQALRRRRTTTSTRAIS